MNLYAYAMNNPIRYTDPKGEAVPLVLCVIGAGVGAGATGVAQIATGNFDGTDLLVAGAVGCASGVVAPVVATTLAGAAALGGVSSAAQYGLSEFLDGCDPTAEGFGANLLGGVIGGALVGRALPKDPKIFSDLWKQPWNGYNDWVNGSHLVRDAVSSGPKTGGVGGVVNTLVEFLTGN